MPINNAKPQAGQVTPERIRHLVVNATNSVARNHPTTRTRRAFGAGRVAQSVSVLENTMESAGNLSDNEVFSRPEFGSAGFSHLHGFGRDGLVRKAGRMADSMFSTSRPPVALEKAASGFQSQSGAETMTIPTLASSSAAPTSSTLGATNPEVINAHAAAENALRMALCYLDKLNLNAARRKAVQALASINAMAGGAA